MKVIPIALATHYAGNATSLAVGCRITRVDGQVFRFTSHDRDVEVDGELYMAGGNAIGASSVQTGSDGRVGDSQLRGLFEITGIDEGSIRAGLWDYAATELFEFNWRSPTDGINKMLSGNLGQVQTGRAGFHVEFLSLSARMQQAVGRTYTQRCGVDLGSAKCGVDLVPLTVTGSFTSVTDARTAADATRAEASGYFTGGLLTITSGANADIGREVKLFNGGEFITQLPFPYPIEVGATYSVYPGCDHNHFVEMDAENEEVVAVHGDCKNKFDNVINYRGFQLPGNDRVIGDAGRTF